jgi:hypothetical protein
MKKIAIAALILLVVSLAANAGQTPTVLKVKVQTANVRAQADTTGAVIKLVSLGTLLEARAKVGDWYEITITTDAGTPGIGFISATVVDVIGGGQAPAPVREAAPVPPPVKSVAPEQAPPAYSGPVPSTGGFKIMAAFGLGSISYDTSKDTSGYNIAQFKSSRKGFGGGVGFETGSTIGFEIDVLYLQKGVAFSGTYQTNTFSATVKLDEVSLPVLLKFHVLNKAGLPDIYLLGGGEIAYVMTGKVDWNGTGPDVPSPGSGSEDLLKDPSSLNRIDYGAIFGGGVTLPLGGVKLFVEARYHLGFSDLEKVVSGETPSGAKPHTSLLAVVGGLKF